MNCGVVSLLRCDDYEYNKVKAKIDKTFENLGGIKKFIKPGMKVLVKINLLMKKKPEEATTTHPVFVEALVKTIQDAGGIVVIADSPGGLYTKKVLKGIYSVTGIENVAKKTGAILNYDLSYKKVSFSEGKICKSFTVISPVVDADIVITVPKLKTHSMTLYTGAVKNLFGVIPGTHKAEYHFRMQDKKDFCNMLVDLCEFVKPTLAIMDAIIGMEGNGPSAGNPRQIGAIIGSSSPYLVDLIASAIIGLKPSQVYTISNSISRGLVEKDLSKVEIIGENLDSFVINNYKIPKSKSINFLNCFPKFIRKGITRYLSPKPEFAYDLCIGCRRCFDNCPAKAITMNDNKPYIDFDKCIKCFCCQELCPQKAVKIKRPKFIEKFLK